ncbi:hypothetical protein [Roseburia intestinalis]
MPCTCTALSERQHGQRKGPYLNRQMHSLIQEMIHYRNGLSESEEPDPQTVSEFEERYKTILSIAGDEYDYEPPGKYYRDGYNLYKKDEKSIRKIIFFSSIIRMYRHE